MINCADIQTGYNKLYEEVRRYIWSFQAVEALADLELACYETCLDLTQVRAAFNRFRSYALDAMYDDEELSAAFDQFEKLINSDDTSYANLYQTKEVFNHENNI